MIMKKLWGNIEKMKGSLQNLTQIFEKFWEFQTEFYGSYDRILKTFLKNGEILYFYFF